MPDLNPDEAVATLRRIGRACQTGTNVEPRDAAWLADTLGVRLDVLAGHAGQTARAEALRARDRMLRRVAAAYPDGTMSGRARDLAFDLSRYRASTSWRVERRLDEPPASVIGTRRELLWRILQSEKICGPTPLSHRHLVRILVEGE